MALRRVMTLRRVMALKRVMGSMSRMRLVLIRSHSQRYDHRATLEAVILLVLE